MLPVFLIAIAASAIPEYNVNRTCRADTDAGQDRGAYQSCIRDEDAAKAKVAREWTRYSAVAQQSCASDEYGVSHSYVELMACFEMHDWNTRLQYWDMHLSHVGGRFSAGSQSLSGSPLSID
jgi:hypothetical protein